MVNSYIFLVDIRPFLSIVPIGNIRRMGKGYVYMITAGPTKKLDGRNSLADVTES